MKESKDMQDTITIRFIYVGRLDLEKGVDLCIEVFKSLLDGGYSISLDVFGGGVLQKAVHEFADQYPSVVYHGFQPKSEILNIWKTMDYCLIPSRFLETFGLTALDSLGVGVPIIAPSKGGLSAFVSNRLTLDECSIESLKKTVIDAVGWRSNDEEYTALVKDASERYAVYGYRSRYTRVQGLGMKKTCLVINDYGANHGGIETLLDEMNTQLQQSGHVITTCSGSSKKLNQLQRYLGLFKTFLNLGASRRICAIENDSELIWWHSVHRQLGRLPLYCSSSDKKHWIMIHDMGLLHPFPSHVEKESQIVVSSTFAGWISEGVAAKGYAWIPLLIAKWLSIKLIWRQVERKNMIIQVPSEYLLSHVKRKVKRSTVVCLPHFVLQ